jgi:circadian clock protein KaiC
MNEQQSDPPTDGNSELPRISTGSRGLDDVLGGGIDPERMYLYEGRPGSGKTTLALQFLLEGVRNGERVLYVTLSETENELRLVAKRHGWSLDGITIFELVPPETTLDPSQELTVLHPAEMELSETSRLIFDRVEGLNPNRIVIDSLSELRLLAQSPLRYRRQILALKHFFSGRRSTVVLLDDLTAHQNDLQLHSIAHGVVLLQQLAIDYGACVSSKCVVSHLRVASMTSPSSAAGWKFIHVWWLRSIAKNSTVISFPAVIRNWTRY